MSVWTFTERLIAATSRPGHLQKISLGFQVRQFVIGVNLLHP